MSRRVAVVVLVGAAAVFGATSALVALYSGGSPPVVPSRSEAGTQEYVGSEPPAGFTMTDFSLRSNHRRVVRSGDLRERVAVLTFLDSQCTESCPVIAWTVARTLDRMTEPDREQIRAVAISTDPGEDTQRSVRQFLARNRAVGRLIYLGGGQPEGVLRRVWNEFKVLSSLESGADALHSAPVRIYDRSGLWVSTLHAGADLTEINLEFDIRVAMASGR